MCKKIASVLLLMLLLISGCSDSHENEARPPKSATSLKRENYKDVVTLFESSGFTNIELEKIEDLIIGWLVDDGSVESVSINGDSNYSTSKWYAKDSLVRISYHTFPAKEEESVIEKPKKENYGLKTIQIGEYSFDVPDYWDFKDPYLYAETGEGVTMVYYHVDDKIPIGSFEELEALSDSFLEGLSNSIESFKKEYSKSVKFNEIGMVEQSFSGSTNDIDVKFLNYLIFQSKTQSFISIMFGQSLKSEYDHVEEFQSLIKSIKTSDTKKVIIEESKDEDIKEDNLLVEQPEKDEIKEEKTEEIPATSESKPSSAAIYTSNGKDTYKNGNSGKYAYVASHKLYDSYIIVDFDDGYVYMFNEGDGNTTCDKVKIVSGTLNDVVIITFNDGGLKWSYGLHFKWAKQPDRLVLEDNDHYTYDYIGTDLQDALNHKNKKKIYNY